MNESYAIFIITYDKFAVKLLTNKEYFSIIGGSTNQEISNLKGEKMDILVLIDWQNVFKTCEARIKLDDLFAEIHKRVLERGTLTEIRLFVPNYQLISSPWKLINQLQLRFGVTVSVCPALREGAEMEEGYKDLVDFEVLRWIMQYIHSGVSPELVVFVSGDGHFLVAANEAKARGKLVEFWIVNPETTSDAILKLQTVREIRNPGLPTLVEPEENIFLEVLAKIRQGKEPDDLDREKLSYLWKATRSLAEAEKPITLERKLEEATQRLQQELGISFGDSRQILKVLITLGAARIYPVVSAGLTIDDASPFLEWLKLKIAP